MKILIVDDHPIVRSGLRRLLSTEPDFDLEDAATGQEALRVFRQFQPDLVILDLNLPGISGLEVINRLKIENARVHILILSMHDNPIYVTRALQAGAKGYVSKNAPPEEILTAIKRVAGGHICVENEIAQELALWNIRSSSHPLKALSTRDLEILRLLGEGSSLPEIAQVIGVSYKTVANHCTQMKAKLGTPRTADLIRFAISCGISGGDPGRP
jgi:two-component system, NarL family, invasion response regulator UvrY